MKPGWKTTEFWFQGVADVMGLFLLADVFPATHWAVELAGAATRAVWRWLT